MKNKLKGEIIDIQSIDDLTKESMYQLMDKYYDNVKKQVFEKDLYEKDSVIILRDVENQHIKGFSTLEVLEKLVLKRLVRVLFSGDTIIDKNYWGSSELPKLWFKYAFKRKKEKPQIPFYWFLMSKGYKTYKFLTIFFKDFYPRLDGFNDSNYKTILDVFASYKYPENYRSESGLIIFHGTKDKLKKGVAEIDKRKMKDSHISFFVKKNPNWHQGDELACIARIDEDNVTRRVKALLEST